MDRMQTSSPRAGRARRSPAGFLFLFLLICALGLVAGGYINSLRRGMASLETEVARLEGELTALRETQAAVPTPEPEPEPEQEPQEEEDAAKLLPVADADGVLRSIAHRGLSALAPENTLPAFILARESGFIYVETDICFTADGVPVCLHDPTVDRTSDGTGAIGDLTLEEVRKLDFGAWMSPDYAGTRISTLEEFLILCRSLGLRPYIELKANGGCTEARVRELVNIVRRYGLQGKVTWLSFSADLLFNVRYYDNAARLGYLVQNVTADTVNTARRLRTSQNEVFLDSRSFTDEECQRCANAGIPLEIWTVNDESVILSMNPYITGVTSDSLLAGTILYESYLEQYG